MIGPIIMADFSFGVPALCFCLPCLEACTAEEWHHHHRHRHHHHQKAFRNKIPYLPQSKTGTKTKKNQRKFIDNNNNRRLVTLAEHTSNHGKQTNSSTKEKGEHG